MLSPHSQSGAVLAEEFAALWAKGDTGDVFAFLDLHCGASPREQLDVLLVDQEERWRHGSEIPVERYLEKVRAVAEDESLKLLLVLGDFASAASRGRAPQVGDYLVRFPEIGQRLRSELKKTGLRARETGAGDDTMTSAECPDGTGQPHAAGKPTVPASTAHPARIGRYAIEKPLGSGGFGRVYLAHDEDLDRPIAIKVPRDDRLATRKEQDDFIREAQLLARLEHPGIVPVYDVGRTADGRCFIVSKYIDGSDLTKRMEAARLTPATSAQIVADVAEALHSAHSRRIIHRDVKPANILLDRSGRAFIADFGIALKEEDLGRNPSIVGTLPYMSPEQLRGEGHLVDGRSDIFSLGVVFYELLTGQRPFAADRLQRMTSAEARPPRQLNDQLPRELERICLKALCKRAADRYATAKDIADDLRHWLDHPHPQISVADVPTIVAAPPSDLQTAPLRVVPKGLRCFDSEDTEFFLELIPGPRDREGLPDIIRFWKTRIESRDPEKAFRAGLIYGPSGCGKSSLLRAGLIPRLDASVSVIFLDATSEGTETELLKRLHSAYPGLRQARGLADALVRVRRGEGPAAGQKLLIVFDQFEQWLHSRGAKGDSELVEALRQCDGSRLQCLIGVRDDFWMGITQFMHDLEVDLAPDRNVAPLPLLSPRHATKVIIAYGRAFGALPYGDLSPEQERFVEEVVDNLAQQDHVIPVRLALFAEMIKDRRWETRTLAAIGGMDGIGVAFLEDSFSSGAALPAHRLHQRAARAVLRSLLPEGAETIKGDMRSRDELLAVSGYAESPAAFEMLLRILDNDLRLITPTEQNFEDSATPDSVRQSAKVRYYHLTHDYLVPPLREWLTRKQKETRRGRAELLLDERAAVWNARPTRRSLPSFVEWFNILLLTSRLSRRKSENQAVQRAAARFYVSRVAVAAVLILFLAWGTLRLDGRSRAQALVMSLGHARTQDVPAIIAEIGPVRTWADPLLRASLASPDVSQPAHLHAAMALLPVDRSQEEPVYEALLTASPNEMAAIRDALSAATDRKQLDERLWKELFDLSLPSGRRFRAGASLASLDPPVEGASSERWQKASPFLSEQLIAELSADTTAVRPWIELLTPLRTILYPNLRGIFVAAGRPQVERHLAATVLGEFVAAEPRELVDLILEAEPDQYAILLPKLRQLGQRAQNALMVECNTAIPAPGPAEVRRTPLKRHANAAVTLLEFGVADLFEAALLATSDPDLSTYAEDRASSLAVRPDLLMRSMKTADATLRAAFLRCLGGIVEKSLPHELSDDFASAALHFYQADSDAGVHSAAERALRAWGLDDRLKELKRVLATQGMMSSRGWYVNRAGQTMAITKGPVLSRIGSPPDEPERDSDETIRVRRINRDFALSTTEVTVDEFLKFKPDYRHQKKKDQAPTRDCPIVMLTWHRAAEYCNWLSKLEGLPQDQWCYEIRSTMAKPFADYLTRTGYRLPTDAEWEYACRGGTTTAYSWGNDRALSRRFAWTIENSGSSTRPVAKLWPNQFGMFDMHGNVSEWTQDLYRYNSNSGALLNIGDDVEDKGFSQDTDRIVRGGNASQLPQYARSANIVPAKAYSGVSTRIGFRVARSLPRDNR